MAAIISFVVLFPVLPVTATSRLPHLRRTSRPSVCSALRVSATAISAGRHSVGRAGVKGRLHHHAGGAAFQRLPHKLVAVKPRSANGEEKLAGRERARINGVSLDAAIRHAAGRP